ncbi:glycosyltransferase family 4 protein [Sinosporangium siamense]|uniref:Uncharacterized protein n=1 Tax=Sinosporangium siamense TaxID=1367973 RepID=A0A919V520_9ACTN|nr:glycosyltransferase family 4 protein [Sinosporangium siamense]GII91098.1 hypothetical protein Ssi02_13290 [Sinosporangium siamense]
MVSDPQPRRVAVVNWRDPWHPAAGGAEVYAWEIATRLAAAGSRVTFVTARAPGQSAGERRDGVTVVRMGGTFGVYPRVLLWLAGRRRRFDAVIDCQNGIPFFTPLVTPRRTVVVGVVHHVHDAQFGVHFPRWLAAVGRTLEGPVARRVYRRHTSAAVSPSTEVAMRRRLGWLGPIVVIPNGCTPPPVRLAPRQSAPAVPSAAAPEPVVSASSGPAPEPATSAPAGTASHPLTASEGLVQPSGSGSPASPYGADSGAPSLVCVGRLVAHKRVERIVELAGALRGRHPGLQVHIIGKGPEEDRVRALIERRSLAGVVRLHGFLPEEDKARLVAGARLHLSASQGEGWGLSVLEAAALGVPTVAYDVDGLRDAVRDSRTGWLVRPGDTLEDVVEAALKELSDPERRAEVSADCGRWAARFDWDASAARMAVLLAGGRDTSPWEEL